MKLKAIILAAGQGSRMKSKIPKVLHKICGETMLNHVINVAKESNIDQCIAVIGHGAQEVKQSLPEDVETVLQEEQLGTGHAVIMAEEYIEEATILVLCGDGPLIQAKTLKDLMEYHKTNNYKASVLTTELKDTMGYGRIVRNKEGCLEKIVEERDTTEEEKLIREINSGTYCFDGKILKKSLAKLNNNNTQKEYYLTDVLSIIKNMDFGVGIYKIEEYEEIMAVNSRQQLAEVEAIMRKTIARKHMEEGVTIINPDHTYIEKGVKIGMDTIIYPGVSLRGNTIIGEDCIIGENSIIEDSIIENNVEIQNSTILNSRVDDNTSIGPYAYLRPGCKIGKNVKIGDFVEVKNSTIGDHSKASHLAYIGDAQVGKNVNIGCGVVFVNYDGKNKNKTIVEDNVFIGSNSNLIAPLTIREEGFVACGSTITREVPKGSLAVGRARQENKEGWVTRKNRSKK